MKINCLNWRVGIDQLELSDLTTDKSRLYFGWKHTYVNCLSIPGLANLRHARYFSFIKKIASPNSKKDIIELHYITFIFVRVFKFFLHWQRTACQLSFYIQLHSVFKILPKVLDILKSYFQKEKYAIYRHWRKNCPLSQLLH